VAIAFDDSAKLARDGRLTAAQMRKVIAESVSKIMGEKPHLHTIADWCREWAADKKLSRSEGTAKRYAMDWGGRRTVCDIRTFPIGLENPRRGKDLSTCQAPE
jgi:hypothetical protein